MKHSRTTSPRRAAQAEPLLRREVTQEEFETTISQFPALEPARGPLYDMALALLRTGNAIEAYLLILATWDFAYFRYILTTFDLTAFRETIEETRPHFERLDGQDIRTADLAACQNDITHVYTQFKDLVKQTGASKLLHFRNPSLFVMWDTRIRRRYRIPAECGPTDYISFLSRMKRTFGHLGWTRNDRTFAKAIDEYNFVKTQE